MNNSQKSENIKAQVNEYKMFEQIKESQKQYQ